MLFEIQSKLGFQNKEHVMMLSEMSDDPKMSDCLQIACKGLINLRLLEIHD